MQTPVSLRTLIISGLPSDYRVRIALIINIRLNKHTLNTYSTYSLLYVSVLLHWFSYTRQANSITLGHSVFDAICRNRCVYSLHVCQHVHLDPKTMTTRTTQLLTMMFAFNTVLYSNLASSGNMFYDILNVLFVCACKTQSIDSPCSY